MKLLSLNCIVFLLVSIPAQLKIVIKQFPMLLFRFNQEENVCDKNRKTQLSHNTKRNDDDL